MKLDSLPFIKKEKIKMKMKLFFLLNLHFTIKNVALQKKHDSTLSVSCQACQPFPRIWCNSG